MSSTDPRGLDEFLAEVDAVVDQPDVDAAQVQRVLIDELAAGTVLWRIVRASPEPWREERIISRDDGFWYEAAAPAEGDNERADVFGRQEYALDSEVLTVGPWPTVRSLVEWHPTVLVVFGWDDVSVCEVSQGLLAEFLGSDHGEASLPGDLWRIGSGAAVTEAADPIAAWDNGDDYGAPGGDRLYHLYRFDDFYVAFDDSSFVAFGHYDSEEEAIRAWADWYVPGGFEEYDRDDEDYDDNE